MSSQRKQKRSGIGNDKNAVELGLVFEPFLAEPRDWLQSAVRTFGFKKWKKEVAPSVLIHGPMIGQVTDTSASFWFRTDGPCEIGVEISGIPEERLCVLMKEMPLLALSKWMVCFSIYFSYQVFIDGREFIDGSREFGFRTFPQVNEGSEFTIAFGGCSGFVPGTNRSGNLWPIMTPEPC